MAINEPSIIDLCKHVDCRYTLICEASNRARQLIDRKQKEDKDPAIIKTLQDEEMVNPLKKAIWEIERNEISYVRHEDDK